MARHARGKHSGSNARRPARRRFPIQVAGLTLIVAVIASALVLTRFGSRLGRLVDPSGWPTDPAIPAPFQPRGQAEPWVDEVCRDKPLATDLEPNPRLATVITSSQSQIVELLADELSNEHRREAGLPELEPDEELRNVARRHSQDMHARGYFSHDDPDGLSPSDRVHRGHRRLVGESGENIWMCKNCARQDADALAAAIVTEAEGWMNSPKHRENILRQRFTHGVVGLALHGKDVWATQLFAEAHGYLTTPVPRRIARGSCLLLRVEPYPDSRPQAARFELFDPQARVRALEPRPVGTVSVNATPGHFLLKFHFPVDAARFAVVRGPTLQLD
jgi:uncharacterized protein YkwD